MAGRGHSSPTSRQANYSQNYASSDHSSPTSRQVNYSQYYTSSGYSSQPSQQTTYRQDFPIYSHSSPTSRQANYSQYYTSSGYSLQPSQQTTYRQDFPRYSHSSTTSRQVNYSQDYASSGHSSTTSRQVNYSQDYASSGHSSPTSRQANYSQNYASSDHSSPTSRQVNYSQYYTSSGDFKQYPIGLENYGSTCYLNVILQCLFMTKTFRDGVLKYGDTGAEFQRVLFAIFKQLNLKTQPQRSSMEKIIQLLGVDVYRQEDAAEYLLKIVKNCPENLSEIFMGRLNRITECNAGHKLNVQEEKFFSLSISVSLENVEKSLLHHFDPITMTGDNQPYCSGCEKKTNMETRRVIAKYPEILTLHFKKHDHRRYGQMTINTKIKIKDSEKQNEIMYELYAFVRHTGDYLSGHYTACISSFEDGNWYIFDDARVTLFRGRDTKDGIFIHRNWSEPYALLYKRLHSVSLPEDVTADQCIESPENLTSGQLQGLNTENNFDQVAPANPGKTDYKNKKSDREVLKSADRSDEDRKTTNIMANTKEKKCHSNQKQDPAFSCKLVKQTQHDEVKHTLTRSSGLSRLEDCSATEASCSALAVTSVRLPECDISGNHLGDAGVKKLCKELGNQCCQLKILKLRHCRLTPSFPELVSVVRFPSLEELDISKNYLQDAGVEKLCQKLENSFCELKTLKLEDCSITEASCSALSSVLSSRNLRLTELDISGNHLGDAGVKKLCDGLGNPCCQLKILKLEDCSVTEASCSALASVLRSRLAGLTKLDISENHLGDAGVKKLCEGLSIPGCKVEILKLRHCRLTPSGFSKLALAVRLLSLKELDISKNHLLDAGVEKLCQEWRNSFCKPKTLKLEDCSLTKESCSVLASFLLPENSSLIELDISENDLGDAGVKRLCKGLRPSKLEILNLRQCSVTKEGCDALAGSVQENDCLRELDLRENPQKCMELLNVFNAPEFKINIMS